MLQCVYIPFYSFLLINSSFSSQPLNKSELASLQKASSSKQALRIYRHRDEMRGFTLVTSKELNIKLKNLKRICQSELISSSLNVFTL